MGAAIHVLLLGSPSSADERIRRMLEMTWRRTALHCAPDPEAAIQGLKAGGAGGAPITPDLIIAKVAEPARARSADFENIRRYRLLQNAPVAAFMDGGDPGAFRCLRGCGLTAVLTRQGLRRQLPDIVDAVADNWLISRGHDCSDRYFCGRCVHCVMTKTVRESSNACDTDRQ